MLDLILKSLYFFLPVYFANMAPVLFTSVRFADTPIQEKWFGKNKTWRGILVSTLTGGIVFWIQQLAHAQGFTSLSLIEYTHYPVVLGFSMGFGAIIGDLVKSYYKRKEGIAPGKPWYFFDQIDFVLGGILFSFFFIVPSANVILVLLIASPILHLIVNYIGYVVGIRKNKI
jgi:CDP-2,3-bis-(O-geranylgeranyl)-sn-glycerol synthase